MTSKALVEVALSQVGFVPKDYRETGYGAWYGLNNKVEQHRKLTRFSFPIWLYVTATGVIVYFMISPYYPF